MNVLSNIYVLDKFLFINMTKGSIMT